MCAFQYNSRTLASSGYAAVRKTPIIIFISSLQSPIVFRNPLEQWFKNCIVLNLKCNGSIRKTNPKCTFLLQEVRQVPLLLPILLLFSLFALFFTQKARRRRRRGPQSLFLIKYHFAQKCIDAATAADTTLQHSSVVVVLRRRRGVCEARKPRPRGHQDVELPNHHQRNNSKTCQNPSRERKQTTPKYYEILAL